ncbi:MAG: glycoside hydrolase, partial [Gemmatimonadaceae bacterium]
FRGGRTKASTGVPQQPNVFYIAAVNGGVWKTTDFGRTWNPIFDGQPTGSVGALAIAPSDTNVIYVGSGEGLQRPDLSTGDGIYKSIDGGKSWRHLGLRSGQQIPQIVIDPRDPNRLFVAVLGHPYGPNEERGVYRSTDGGETFKKVLGKDENTGAIDIVMSPNDPNTLYAALWEARQGPWENSAWQGAGTGLFKSTDGGDNWTSIMTGLPTPAEGLGRIGIAVAPSSPSRLFVTIDAGARSGIYRSDNAGASWAKTSTDERVHNRGSDFAEVKVDPKNPDVVYSASIVVWKSTDAGVNWSMIRGAPGGDDYHRIWINPDNTKIILIGSDQGAIITVNGGDSWSSWYNQPTAQFYHVATDNSYPYRVCGGQQESGSACVQSRGNDGQITFREWRPVGVEEYGYVAPDPLDPNVMFGGKVTRFDYRTGQTQNIAPKPFRDANYRTVRTAPILFAPTNPRKLYFAANTLWSTVDAGNNWTELSPDLTRRDSTLPPNVGKYASETGAASRHAGVIYTIAPSYVKENVIWVGSDDGLIHVTMNGGKTWKNVTPPTVGPWAKVSIMDASHFDTLSAYAAINTLRLDDLRPHIYRTHDGGKSWTEIVTGIDSGATINVVREDPKQKGLLYAGSETKVWVSFDDGNSWRSLQVNMPATSIRDLVIKDNDLVVGTHGRGFWILDDITPLREVASRAQDEDVHLFRPALATRVRYSMYTDTPLPVDEPRAANPPDGAVLHYFLKRSASALSLDILDATGKVVRHYDKGVNPDPDPRSEGHWPDWWIRPSPVLSPEAGLHRFVWDIRHPRPKALSFSFAISAIPGQSVPEPLGPFAAPGVYTVRLTVDGKSVTQRLTIRMDPRVTTPAAGIAAQHLLAVRLADGIDRAAGGIEKARELAIAARGAGNEARAKELESLVERSGRLSAPTGGPSLTQLSGQLTQLLDVIDGADRSPTSQARGAANAALSQLESLLAKLK